MAKGRKRPDPNEYVHVYYGINRRTFEVESVWQTRSGALRTSFRCLPTPPIQKFTKKRVDALKEKAAEMKAERNRRQSRLNKPGGTRK